MLLQAPDSTERDAFRQWLADEGAPPVLHVFCHSEDGQVVALVEEYDVVGFAADKEAAIDDALGNLCTYLVAEFRDGKSVADAARPVPRKVWIRNRASVQVGRVAMLMHRAGALEFRLPLPTDRFTQHC